MKNSTTADRLKQIMANNGLKQVDILDACKPYCEKYGVQLRKSDLSQYVAGKVEPRQDKLSILGMALNVDEAWLMGYDVPTTKQTSQETEKSEFSKDTLSKESLNMLQLFNQLDNFDKGKIIGKIESMLEDDKYSSKRKSKNA